MSKIKEKLYDWKNRLKDRHMLSIVLFFIAIILILGGFGYYKELEYIRKTENDYNMAFNEMVNDVEHVQTFLAKSLISVESNYSAEILTNVWKEANLAQSHLAQLPINNEGLSNASKFLNQVSDYSYSLSRKNFNQEDLTQEDLDNLTSLYKYSIDLNNTLNQLSNELYSGEISWKKLSKETSLAFAQEVSNIKENSFDNIEQNFHDYAGLIYDGAFSEHVTNLEKKGLTGENISEEDGKKIVSNFIGDDKIENINFSQELNNANIDSYEYIVDMKNDKNNKCYIGISKKGGKVIYMNYNKEIAENRIDKSQVIEKGSSFLKDKGFDNMVVTYYMEQDGILVINYAYKQGEVLIYSDLIKLKVALDDGEILGIETTGYLNSHYIREIPNKLITKEEAKKKLNSSLQIESEKLAIIPTEYKTEKLCWEFKCKINDREFLVYINAQNGKEEDILIIVNSENGTLTM